MGFIPRRYNNVAENELTKALVLNGTSAEFLSFKLPKRYGDVQDYDVYEN